MNYLMNTTEHPTAERIHQDLKTEIPNLSLATVYRNLGQLVSSGSVIRLSTGDKTDHYDADLSEHQHFICSECDSVTDLFFKLPKEILDSNIGKNCETDTYRLYVYGVCEKCKKSKK
ncbi:MAG: transcriptional repressor [Clostridia bacterium]|nr:transcriptional repressor [Clostridia bacterium]